MFLAGSNVTYMVPSGNSKMGIMGAYMSFMQVKYICLFLVADSHYYLFV